jgi:molybdopterin-guanine dinucleotide biosynthesis protein A
MGRPKALLPYGDGTLIAHIAQLVQSVFAEIVVVAADPVIGEAARLPAIGDVLPGQRGAAAGIHAALTHFSEPVFVVACDMPALKPAFLRYMAQMETGHDVLVPRHAGHCEPLHAIYAPSALARLTVELERPHMRPLQRIIAELHTRYIEESDARRFDPELAMFDNWNSSADMAKTSERMQ